MGQRGVTVLLVEDSPEYAELVQHWISSAAGDGSFVLNWTDSLAAALSRLEQGDVGVILLDLGLPDSDGAETFLKIRRRTAGTPIIILSAADNDPVALSLIKKGAEDYLVKSACNSQILVRALRYAIERCRWRSFGNSQLAYRQARVIGVLGCKGGVGTTTIACGLATELARQPAQKVLLMDLDTMAGAVPFLMNLEPKYSVLDAIRKLDRLDLTCWEAIVTRVSDQLGVLPLPSPDWYASELAPDGIAPLLSWARPAYDWIVMDLGRCRRFAMDLLEEMDDICLIATPAIPTLFEAKRAIDAVLKACGTKDRLRLVINQTEEQVSANALQQLLGIGVYAQIPADPAELDAACRTRRMPDQGTAIGKEMIRLASKLSGLPERGGPYSRLRKLTSIFRRGPTATSPASAGG